MKPIYNNDLPTLINIIDTFQLPNPITPQDLEDIRESIQLIIEKSLAIQFS